MKDWPTNWRNGGMFDIKPPHMERMCPHGVGHPDPDDVTNLGEDVIGIHGCDGCCVETGYAEFDRTMKELNRVVTMTAAEIAAKMSAIVKAYAPRRRRWQFWK